MSDKRRKSDERRPDEPLKPRLELGDLEADGEAQGGLSGFPMTPVGAPASKRDPAAPVL